MLLESVRAAQEDRKAAAREFADLAAQIFKTEGVTNDEAARLAAERRPDLFARATARVGPQPLTRAQVDARASERTAFVAAFDNKRKAGVTADQAIAEAAASHPAAFATTPPTPATPSPVVVKLTRPTGTGTAAERDAEASALQRRIAELQAKIQANTPASHDLPTGWAIKYEKDHIDESGKDWWLYAPGRVVGAFESREAAMAYAWAYVGPEAA